MFDLIPFRRRGGMVPFFDEVEKRLMQSFGGQLSDFRADIVDRGDSFVLEAELPGFNKDDINIDVDDNRLTITAEHSESKEESRDNYIRKERRFGSFSRSFDVSNIRTDEIKADYKDGVLKLDLPKKGGKDPGRRRIDIG